MKREFKNPTFLATAYAATDYPKLAARGISWPEVALAGRSNVGKSSLLNDLFQARGLAKTSKRPGKTAGINFYKADDFLLIDLPGYGYAKVSASMKTTWATSIEEYLVNRSALTLVLFLLDIRHLPSEEDLLFYRFLQAQNKKTVLVLTKADKIAPGLRAKHTEAICEALGSPSLPVVHYSTHTPEGRKPLIAEICRCLS